MSGNDPRHALVFGASGLVGRRLIVALLDAGARVTAAVRTPESGARIVRWLRDHGVEEEIATTPVDFDAEGLIAGDVSSLDTVTEVHNCAGSYRFGMTAAQARSANVGIVEKVVELAAALPRLRRVVHVSGYRVGGQDPSGIPWSDEHRDALYADLGAYEASKVESDAIFQARATARGLPWTIVNPATVIGDSVTGESEQHVGLAASIAQLWSGAVTALPGGGSTFLPVVTVDYLAAFMAAAAVDPAASGRAYWVLDDDTPPLADLLSRVGRHLGARVPRLRVPVGLVTRLPAALTKVDPETVSFLSSDRYPTRDARALADRHGLRMPDAAASLDRWAEYLAARRFGAAEGDDRRYVTAGEVATFERGVAGSPRLILPGLPVNADTWAEVAAGIGARAVDLPGLGLSGGRGIADWEAWLPGILGGEPVDLIGHSIGAAAAVVAADRLPHRIRSLTLVAPFFLQPPARGLARRRRLVAAYLRHVDSRRLSRQLTGQEGGAAALESSVQDLHRATAGRAAAHLAQAASPQWRAELRELLTRFGGPVRIIVGGDDPLLPEARHGLAAASHVGFHEIPGAGHHPQLTHAEALVEALRRPIG